MQKNHLKQVRVSIDCKSHYSWEPFYTQNLAQDIWHTQDKVHIFLLWVPTHQRDKQDKQAGQLVISKYTNLLVLEVFDCLLFLEAKSYSSHCQWFQQLCFHQVLERNKQYFLQVQLQNQHFRRNILTMRWFLNTLLKTN